MLRPTGGFGTLKTMNTTNSTNAMNTPIPRPSRGRLPLLVEARDRFVEQELVSRNVSPKTRTAYRTDLTQFIAFLRETNLAVDRPDQVERADVTEFLAALAAKRRTGVTRARKLASLRSFFAYLVAERLLDVSPAEHVSMPKKERRERVWLRPDEYMRLLSAAGGNARDFSILQLFLQTGVRVSEMASLTIADVSLGADPRITVQGKGKKERVIPLEKKGVQSLKNYLAQRPDVVDQHLFLNYQGRGLSDRGIKKLLEKYRVKADIGKTFGCHSLRHSFGTLKAAQGVPVTQLREWMGHTNLTTTQLYIHASEAAGGRKIMERTSL